MIHCLVFTRSFLTQNLKMYKTKGIKIVSVWLDSFYDICCKFTKQSFQKCFNASRQEVKCIYTVKNNKIFSRCFPLTVFGKYRIFIFMSSIYIFTYLLLCLFNRSHINLSTIIRYFKKWHTLWQKFMLNYAHYTFKAQLDETRYTGSAHVYHFATGNQLLSCFEPRRIDQHVLAPSIY